MCRLVRIVFPGTCCCMCCPVESCSATCDSAREVPPDLDFTRPLLRLEFRLSRYGSHILWPVRHWSKMLFPLEVCILLPIYQLLNIYLVEYVVSLVKASLVKSIQICYLVAFPSGLEIENKVRRSNSKFTSQVL